jgi:hypothetical protein
MALPGYRQLRMVRLAEAKYPIMRRRATAIMAFNPNDTLPPYPGGVSHYTVRTRPPGVWHVEAQVDLTRDVTVTVCGKDIPGHRVERRGAYVNQMVSLQSGFPESRICKRCAP